MPHGKRESMLEQHLGLEYWGKHGLLKRIKAWFPVSDRPGNNKKSKRIINHRKRQEIKKALKNRRDDI